MHGTKYGEEAPRCPPAEKRDWVNQLHFGCLRNNSLKMFRKLGPDTNQDWVLLLLKL